MVVGWYAIVMIMCLVSAARRGLLDAVSNRHIIVRQRSIIEWVVSVLVCLFALRRREFHPHALFMIVSSAVVAHADWSIIWAIHKCLRIDGLMGVWIIVTKNNVAQILVDMTIASSLVVSSHLCLCRRTCISHWNIVLPGQSCSHRRHVLLLCICVSRRSKALLARMEGRMSWLSDRRVGLIHHSEPFVKSVFTMPPDVLVDLRLAGIRRFQSLWASKFTAGTVWAAVLAPPVWVDLRVELLRPSSSAPGMVWIFNLKTSLRPVIPNWLL